MNQTPRPWLKPLVDFGPLAVFLLLYWQYNLFTATGGLMVAVTLGLALSYGLERTVPIMPLVTAGLVLIFGGLTLWLDDERFIKMKPTIINVLFAGALGFGLLRGRSYLKDLIGAAMPLTDVGWMVLTRRWALFFLFMAVVNEVVWRTQTEEFWVTFKTFASPAITFAFIMTQFGLIKKHGVEGSGSDGD